MIASPERISTATNHTNWLVAAEEELNRIQGQIDNCSLEQDEVKDPELKKALFQGYKEAQKSFTDAILKYSNEAAALGLSFSFQSLPRSEDGEYNRIKIYTQPASLCTSIPEEQFYLSGLIISFGKTLEPLLQGKKSVTRRIWKDSHAAKFLIAWDNQQLIRAFDKDPRYKGKQVGWLKLTQEPYKEPILRMPHQDLELEGGMCQTVGEFVDKYFDGDNMAEVWVIRFQLLPMSCPIKEPFVQAPTPPASYRGFTVGDSIIEDKNNPEWGEKHQLSSLIQRGQILDFRPIPACPEDEIHPFIRYEDGSEGFGTWDCLKIDTQAEELRADNQTNWSDESAKAFEEVMQAFKGVVEPPAPPAFAKYPKPQPQQDAPIVDFWCGGGGLGSAGFLQAGFQIGVNIDCDPKNPKLSSAIADCYELNFGKPVVRETLQNYVTRGGFREQSQRPDVVVFTQSCKNLSRVNQKGVENESDIAVAQAACQGIGELLPKVFVLENVREYAKSACLRLIEDALEQHEYKWCLGVLNAWEYGVSQDRERFILVAVHKYNDLVDFPFPSHFQPLGWGDAVRDLIETFPPTQPAPWQLKGLKKGLDSDRLVSGADSTKRSKTTNREADKPAFAVSASQAANRMRLYLVERTGAREKTPQVRESDRPSWTVKAAIFTDGKGANRQDGLNTWDGGGEWRRVTSRGVARLMGLYDWYQLPEAPSVFGPLLGNGLPSEMARAIGEHIKQYLPEIKPMVQSVEREATWQVADRVEAIAPIPFGIPALVANRRETHIGEQGTLTKVSEAGLKITWDVGETTYSTDPAHLKRFEPIAWKEGDRIWYGTPDNQGVVLEDLGEGVYRIQLDKTTEPVLLDKQDIYPIYIPAAIDRFLERTAEKADTYPKEVWLDPDTIILDCGTQSRPIEFDQERLDDYIESMKNGDWDMERRPLPEVCIAPDGRYYAVDCHHRVKAGVRSLHPGRMMLFLVRQGTLSQARLWSAASNTQHGLAADNSPQGVRKRIEMFLDNIQELSPEEYQAEFLKVPDLTPREKALGKFSDRTITRYLRLRTNQYKTVQNIIRERELSGKISQFKVGDRIEVFFPEEIEEGKRPKGFEQGDAGTVESKDNKVGLWVKWDKQEHASPFPIHPDFVKPSDKPKPAPKPKLSPPPMGASTPMTATGNGTNGGTVTFTAATTNLRVAPSAPTNLDVPPAEAIAEPLTPSAITPNTENKSEELSPSLQNLSISSSTTTSRWIPELGAEVQIKDSSPLHAGLVAKITCFPDPHSFDVCIIEVLGLAGRERLETKYLQPISVGEETHLATTQADILQELTIGVKKLSPGELSEVLVNAQPSDDHKKAVKEALELDTDTNLTLAIQLVVDSIHHLTPDDLATLKDAIAQADGWHEAA